MHKKNDALLVLDYEDVDHSVGNPPKSTRLSFLTDDWAIGPSKPLRISGPAHRSILLQHVTEIRNTLHFLLLR